MKPTARQAYLRLFDGRNESKPSDTPFRGNPWLRYTAGDYYYYKETRSGISMRCRRTRLEVSNQPDKATAYRLLRAQVQQHDHLKQCPWK